MRSICQSSMGETNCGGHLTMHKRDINLFWLNLDERLNGSECLPDSCDMTFLTSGNKVLFNRGFWKKMIEMTYIHTDIYRYIAYVPMYMLDRGRNSTVTSYLGFKFYEQDNISSDTGQVFTALFCFFVFSLTEVKQHILEHYQYYCPLWSLISQWNSCSQYPLQVEWSLLLFYKILIRIFTIPILPVVKNEKRFSVCTNLVIVKLSSYLFIVGFGSNENGRFK